MARKPRSADDYQDAVTAASRSGLAEIMTALGAYRDALVLIGGWAPHLILEQFGYTGFVLGAGVLGVDRLGGFVHVGSVDIDLVVDPAVVDAEAYATIVEVLLDRGYEATKDSLFQFERLLRSPRDGQEYLIRVDLLTPSPLKGEGQARRHRKVQRDLKARNLPGAEVALTHWFWYELDARLPDGAQTHMRLKVADVVASLALKGIAIGERYAEKDAYDIYTLCAFLQGGPAAVAEAVRPFVAEDPVDRGLTSIGDKFRALDAEGPTWAATFLAPGNREERARLQQDAFMSVQEVLRLVATA